MKDPTTRIARGRDVFWGSQGRGVWSQKHGRIVRFILSGQDALDSVPGRLQGAIKRSMKNFQPISEKTDRYLIEVFKDADGKEIPPKLYCPRASMVYEVK